MRDLEPVVHHVHHGRSVVIERAILKARLVRSNGIGPQWIPAASSVASTSLTHTAGNTLVTGTASTLHSQESGAAVRRPMVSEGNPDDRCTD